MKPSRRFENDLSKSKVSDVLTVLLVWSELIVGDRLVTPLLPSAGGAHSYRRLQARSAGGARGAHRGSPLESSVEEPGILLAMLIVLREI